MERQGRTNAGCHFAQGNKFYIAVLNIFVSPISILLHVTFLAAYNIEVAPGFLENFYNIEVAPGFLENFYNIEVAPGFLENFYNIEVAPRFLENFYNIEVAPGFLENFYAPV